MGAIVDDGSFVINRNTDFALPNSLTGTGTLTKNGTGRTTISGDASGFTGKTEVNSGQLEVTTNLGSSNVTVASNAILGIGELPKQSFPGASLDSITAVTASNTSGSVAGNITDNGIVVIGRSDNITLSNSIKGSGVFFRMARARHRLIMVR